MKRNSLVSPKSETAANKEQHPYDNHTTRTLNMRLAKRSKAPLKRSRSDETNARVQVWIRQVEQTASDHYNSGQTQTNFDSTKTRRHSADSSHDRPIMTQSYETDNYDPIDCQADVATIASQCEIHSTCNASPFSKYILALETISHGICLEAQTVDEVPRILSISSPMHQLPFLQVTPSSGTG